MGLLIEYVEIKKWDYNLQLPDDFELIDFLDLEDLPDGWNRSTFKVKDLLNQSKDYQNKIISLLPVGAFEFQDYSYDAEFQSEPVEYETIGYDKYEEVKE